MSSPHHLLQSQNSNPNFDEQRWIIHIRRALEEEDDLEQEYDIPPSIFHVPKALFLISPESYVPQHVALGPYHHCRPELYEMERYKLGAAKRTQKHLQGGLKFHHLVDHLARYEPIFRACYHKFLNFNGETLAWMMAVDSCFLLESLQVFSVKTRGLSRMAHLFGRKSGYDAIIRDIIMLENQIPLFSLRKLLEFQLQSSDGAEKMIYEMLTGFGKEIPAVGIIQEMPDFHKCAHLLDFVYSLTVPKLEGSSFSDHQITSEAEKEDGAEKINHLQKIILNLRLLVSKHVKFILSIPWKIICNLPGVIMIKQIQYMCFSNEKATHKDQENKNCDINKHPLMEQIAIPSVTDLYRAGVRFSVTNSGILGIKFDSKMATLYLPRITLDVNSEVVLRNLIAYEACSASGPLIFTRYTELMNGIIDTDEDAKLLRKHGIVLNHLKSDQDVANLWNGMSRSIRLTKVPFLDRVIEDVNGYYNGRWKVRIGRLLKRHVFGSWQPVTLLAAILLLILVSLQTLCSLFGCARKKIN